ncbi:PREDICTED: putative nuclease HARBI1 [Gekko japonicus]|uniref:Nuclease HARBI1 n=1 Tax=Gekko japonicus TaxID=146911 RepID=A0ABM1JMT2_GEKJA|nr:PREDICTED: putative nuclease HARBI1 [Gekko japonicus]
MENTCTDISSAHGRDIHKLGSAEMERDGTSGTSTFTWLVDALRDRLHREHTEMRVPVSVEQRVAVAVWWMANTMTYRTVGQQFGLRRSIIVEVTHAMKEQLLKRVVYLRNPDRVMMAFAAMGFPQCVAAMDGCHIRVKVPVHRAEHYQNRKHYALILLQGTVDHEGHFVDSIVGLSNRNHDAYVLMRSNVMYAMDAGWFVPGNPTCMIEGVQVPPLILANAAYPLRRWLIPPYKGHLNPRQAHFNKVHGRVRNVVERAFGRLKARWQCLLLRLPLDLLHVNDAVSACVILHNVCEDCGHPIPEVLPEGARRPIQEEEDDPEALRYIAQENAGILVREALTTCLCR